MQSDLGEFLKVGSSHGVKGFHTSILNTPGATNLIYYQGRVGKDLQLQKTSRSAKLKSRNKSQVLGFIRRRTATRHREAGAVLEIDSRLAVAILTAPVYPDFRRQVLSLGGTSDFVGTYASL